MPDPFDFSEAQVIAFLCLAYIILVCHLCAWAWPETYLPEEARDD